MRHSQRPLLRRQHLHGFGLCLQHDFAALPSVRRSRRATVLFRQHLRLGLVLQHFQNAACLLLVRLGERPMLPRQHLHGFGLCLQHDFAALPAVRRSRGAIVLLGQQLHWCRIVMQYFQNPAGLLSSVRGSRSFVLLQRQQLLLHYDWIRLLQPKSVCNMHFVRGVGAAMLQRHRMHRFHLLYKRMQRN